MSSHDAIDTLSQLPRVVVYLDAGAADALRPSTAASLLRRAGVAEIQGFFLNSTHFDWTSHEINYGEADLAADRRQALRGQHGRERPGPAGPPQPGQVRQRDPLQPARPRTWAQADLRHRLTRTSTPSPGSPTRASRAAPAASGAPPDRHLLAQAGAASWSGTPTSACADGRLNGSQYGGRARLWIPASGATLGRQGERPGSSTALLRNRG